MRGRAAPSRRLPAVPSTDVAFGDSPTPSPYMTLLDIDGAADHLNVSPRFIRRLVAQRRVNYLKIGKFVRFDQDELDEWVQQQRIDARRPA